MWKILIAILGIFLYILSGEWILYPIRHLLSWALKKPIVDTLIEIWGNVILLFVLGFSIWFAYCALTGV